MYNLFDNLMIDDEYEYAYESYQFDDQNMMVDVALESFSYIDPYTDSFDDDLEFVYASEALMNAIEEDLYAINTEFYIATESSSGNKTGILQKIKNDIAKVLMGLKTFCNKRADNWGRKYPKVGNWWRARAKQCENLANKLRGVKSEEQLQQIKQETEKIQQETSEAAKKEDSNVAKHDATVPGKGKSSRLGDGMSRGPVNAASYQNEHKNESKKGSWDEIKDEYLNKTESNLASGKFGLRNDGRRPYDQADHDMEKLVKEKRVIAAKKKSEKESKIHKIDNKLFIINKKLQVREKNNNYADHSKIFKEKRQLMNEKAQLEKELSNIVEENFSYYYEDYETAMESTVGDSSSSYTVFDYEAGYEIAVEGLFSKPKTAEQLLEKIQKKVNKLNTIGKCDDMLRQLDAEAKNFNGAMVALKKASAEFKNTNDKKTFKRTVGPVLKDLNKRCKILKIKNIASDPKNVTPDEIKKFRDFITGSKQLINARKKVLKGGVTESMSYYDDDFKLYGVLESYMITDPFIDAYEFNIAEESLLDAIDTELASVDANLYIATESDKGSEKVGFVQKVKNQLAKIVDSLAKICKKNIFSSREKGKAKSAAKWEKRLTTCKMFAGKLRGDLDEDEIAMLKDRIEELKEDIKQLSNASILERGKLARVNNRTDEYGQRIGDAPAIANHKTAYTPIEFKKANASFTYLDDFSEADQMIALATEGIINPDFKRAHRIKFGEKKRQIKGVLKRAKAAKKANDIPAAIALYQEAKKGYSGLMAEAKKLPNYTTSSGKSTLGANKTGLINWCISKMSECDNAIEAIKNGQMKSARKAASNESYLDGVYEFESVLESMYDEDDYDDDYYDEDDYDEYGGGIESLMMY